MARRRQRRKTPERLDECANVRLLIRWYPAEYVHLREIADEEGVTMARYVREAVQQRYNRENPTRLGFGEPYRLR